MGFEQLTSKNIYIPPTSKREVSTHNQGFSQRCTNHLLVQRIEETQIIQFLKVLELVRNYSLILANIVVTQWRAMDGPVNIHRYLDEIWLIKILRFTVSTGLFRKSTGWMHVWLKPDVHYLGWTTRKYESSLRDSRSPMSSIRDSFSPVYSHTPSWCNI